MIGLIIIGIVLLIGIIVVQIGKVSELASEIRGENNKKDSDNDYKRLTDTLKLFNEDFKEVICDLIKCDVKYEPCFWYKSDTSSRPIPATS